LSHWKVKEVSFEKIHQFIEFLSKENGKQFVINSISYAEKSYDKIYFRKRKEENNFQIIIDDCTSIKFNEFKLDFNIYDKLPEIKGNNIVAFDGDKLKFPLKVRYRKDGDKLKIKGLEGSKKVSNILTDEKVERCERDRIPIIEKDDDIIYLCGLRQSELYGVSDFTQRYLVISYAKER